MEKNDNSLSKGILIGIVSTLFAVMILFSMGTWSGLFTINGGSLMKQQTKLDTVDEDAEQDFEDRIAKRVHQVLRVMDAYYLEDYDEDEMIDGLLTGMLASVGDPYTGYYDEESYSSLMEDSKGVYYGIGVVVSQRIDSGEVYVVNPYEECPGYEAGMRPNDIILKVEDVEVTGMDLNEVVAMIRGEETTSVNITVLHEKESEPVTMSVERRKIEAHTIEFEVLDNNIGYIQITQFDDVTTQQFKNGMDQLKAQGISGIIVDLRDNPGGSLSTVVDILDTLLPKGTYTYLVDKSGNRTDYKGKIAPLYDFPMVVLVNENSASASELFTGAVHDYERGIIVGTNTFGKGIVQQIFSLKNGTGMKVTMAKYYTPNGVCIHKTGIAPDVEVELDEGEYPSTVSHEDDNQLQKAIEVMMEQLNK